MFNLIHSITSTAEFILGVTGFLCIKGALVNEEGRAQIQSLLLAGFQKVKTEVQETVEKAKEVWDNLDTDTLLEFDYSLDWFTGDDGVSDGSDSDS